MVDCLNHGFTVDVDAQRPHMAALALQSVGYALKPCFAGHTVLTILSLQHSMTSGRAGRPIDGPSARPLCLRPTVLDSEIT